MNIGQGSKESLKRESHMVVELTKECLNKESPDKESLEFNELAKYCEGQINAYSAVLWYRYGSGWLEQNMLEHGAYVDSKAPAGSIVVPKVSTREDDEYLLAFFNNDKLLIPSSERALVLYRKYWVVVEDDEELMELLQMYVNRQQKQATKAIPDLIKLMKVAEHYGMKEEITRSLVFAEYYDSEYSDDFAGCPIQPRVIDRSDWDCSSMLEEM